MEDNTPVHSETPNPPPQWMADLSEREQMQILHAREYARKWGDAGIPGHSQLLIMARLAKKLDDIEYRATHPLFAA